jgi:hypothetical protein
MFLRIVFDWELSAKRGYAESTLGIGSLKDNAATKFAHSISGSYRGWS